MQTIHDKVLIIPDRVPDKIGSIIMPESKKRERTNFGTVLKVGHLNKNVKEGDRVIYSKFHGTEFEINKVRHLVLEADEVEGIIDL